MSTSAGKKPGNSTATDKQATDKQATDKQATSAGADSSAGGVSDVQRKMREALEAKQAKSRSAHGEDHLGGHGVGASSNDVTKRQFRRKSGG